MSFKHDYYEPVSFAITEALAEEVSQVDGKYILARVAGQFFVPNGKSRNERYYPLALWEKVLADPVIQARLQDRRMFGTAGHKLAIDDDALREGFISHIVTRLEIRDNIGYGEALVLDTPVGRTLNTLLRAGCKLFVSSRANGDFEGQTADGVPIVNPDTYQLETFDFVIEPGFLEANPRLVENLIHSLPVGDSNMDLEKLIETLSKENGALKADLERSLKENETIKNDNKLLVEENKHAVLKSDKNESMGRMLERYKAIGSPDEANKALERADKVIMEFRKLGTIKDIQKALSMAHATLCQYKQFGEAKEVKMALEKASYVIKNYKEIGSIPELNTLMTKVEEDQKKVSESRRKEKISALAKDLKVSEEAIGMVYGKLPEADIKKLFVTTITEEKTTEKWRKSDAKTASKKEEAKPSLFDKSRGQRLMEQFSK